MPEAPLISAESPPWRYRFWLYLLAAIVLRQLPFVSIPFNWLESYFHEISHGLAALVSGGEIIRIQLFANGAGLCTTAGGSRLLISLAGYLGAVFWGALIYRLADYHGKVAKMLAMSLMALLVVSMLFWVRDLLTLIICAVLMVIFSLGLKLYHYNLLQHLLRLFGLLVLLNSLQSPWYLLDGRSIGDGAALASLTGLPEIIWVTFWFVTGVATVLWLGKKQ